MAETVFLKERKFDSFIFMDKDFCLSFDNNPTIVGMQLRMKF
jgi:hypothetical protein